MPAAVVAAEGQARQVKNLLTLLLNTLRDMDPHARRLAMKEVKAMSACTEEEEEIRDYIVLQLEASTR